MQLTEIPDQNTPRPRLVDARTGIQVVKGGIRQDTSFLASIVAAYANLVNQPLTLFIGAFLIFTYLAEQAGESGPLEAIKDLLEPIHNKSNGMQIEKQAAYGGLKLIDFLIKWKTQLIDMGFAWLPYLAKPSTSSMYISVVHSIMIFLLRNWSSLTFILISQAHFLFVSLRKPVHKLLIILIAIAFLFLDIELSVTRTKRSYDESPQMVSKMAELVSNKRSEAAASPTVQTEKPASGHKNPK